MKYISFIAALALLVTGTQSCTFRIDKTKALEMVRLFNDYTIKASGNKMTKEIKTENCHRLTISNGIYVEYLQDGKNFVTVNASDNILPYIDVTENDGELTIGVKDSASYNSRIWNMDAKVTVHGSALGSLDLKGSGDFTCKELSMPDDLVTIAITGSGTAEFGKILTSEFGIDISGSGSLDCEEIKTGRMDALVRGSSDVEFDKVNADVLTASVRGSGDMDFDNVNVNSVEAYITGSGDISLVGKTGKATYMVVGSGDIDAAKMKCGAEPDITVTGSGSVSYQTADGKIKSK